MAAYRSVIFATREQFGAERTPLEQCDTYGRASLKGMNLGPMDEGVRRFVLAGRFAEIAPDLPGVEGVRVSRGKRNEPARFPALTDMQTPRYSLIYSEFL